MNKTNEELAIEVQNGNTQAAAELWDRVYKLIKQKTYRYYNARLSLIPNDLELCDFEQAAYFAMLGAAKDYKPEKGYQFNTYLDYHLLNVFEDLRTHHHRRSKAARAFTEVSVFSPMTGIDEDLELLDTLADDTAVNQEEAAELNDLQLQVRSVVSELSNQKRETIEGYFFYGETLGQIAERLGVSLGRVSAVKWEAFRVLRKSEKLKALYVRTAASNRTAPSEYRRPDVYVELLERYHAQRQSLYSVVNL